MAKSFVVMLKGYLGDAIMAIPLLESLRGMEATVAANPAIEGLLGPSLQHLQFLHLQSSRSPFKVLQNAAKLRSFDTAIVVNRSFRSALTAWLSRVPSRIGHAAEGRSFLLTKVLTYDENRNEAECYLDLAEAAGLVRTYPKPQLSLSNDEKEAGTRWLQGATVGLQPGARHDWKQVPSEAFIEAGRWLEGQGHRVALFGGTEERQASDLVATRLTNPVDLVGKLKMRESAAALAGLRLVVGGDTGVMHLGAAVGCPTVTAFGPTVAEKWGYFDPPHQVVRAAKDDIRRIEGAQLIEACGRALT